MKRKWGAPCFGAGLVFRTSLLEVSSEIPEQRLGVYFAVFK
jgi:hypothetical protein